MAGRPVDHEQVRQRLEHVGGSQVPRHHERQALARVLVHDREDLHRPAIPRPVTHEVIRPDVMPVRRPQPEARAVREPQAPPFRLLQRHLQPFASPEPRHPLVVHPPALPPQQSRHRPVPVAAILTRQRGHALRQGPRLGGHPRGLALGATGLAHHPACPPLRDAQASLHLHDGRATPGRAQKFPDVTSLRMALSSAWSATSRFNRVFSRSSSFRRLA